MKYFIDTEFIEGFKKPLFGKRRHFIDLISIGIVCEDGRKYYAISNEYNWNDADDWVKSNVIIPMYRQEISGDKRNHIDAETFHKYIPNGKSLKQIANEVRMFCHYGGPEVINQEFYGYYADYDWVLLCSLFGRMVDLPLGFPMYCKDLKQDLDAQAEGWRNAVILEGQKPLELDYYLSALKSSEDYPKEENEHNALSDAKWNKRLFEFLQTL